MYSMPLKSCFAKKYYMHALVSKVKIKHSTHQMCVQQHYEYINDGDWSSLCTP